MERPQRHNSIILCRRLLRIGQDLLVRGGGDRNERNHVLKLL